MLLISNPLYRYLFDFEFFIFYKEKKADKSALWKYCELGEEYEQDNSATLRIAFFHNYVHVLILF